MLKIFGVIKFFFLFCVSHYFSYYLYNENLI